MLAACQRPVAARGGVELADIFRSYGESYRRNHPLPVSHLKVIEAVERCRTAALGGHIERCNSCGFERPAYNSCRNRSASGGPIAGQAKVARETKVRNLAGGILPSCVHLASRTQRSDPDQQKDSIKSSL